MDDTTTTLEAPITTETQALINAGSPTPAPTKAEIVAAERLAKRQAKEAKDAKRKADNAEKRANGVIGTLHQMLQAPAGTTKRAVLDALTAKFPERDPIGMATTVGIQLSRLQKKHGKIVSRKQDGRGLVYGYQNTVQFAPEGSPGVTIPAADLMIAAGQVADLPVDTTPTEPITEVTASEITPTPEPIAEPTPTPTKPDKKNGKKHGKR